MATGKPYARLAPTDRGATRIANLRLLIAQWSGPSALAKKLHLSGPSYLSQLIGGARPVTEKTARKYESLLGLPSGWLDEPRDAGGKTARVDADLVTRAVLLVGALLEETGTTVKPSKFADIVAMVYEEAARGGELREGFVKQLINLTTR